MTLNSDLSLSTVLQLIAMVAGGAVLFGVSMQRDDAQDKAISSLERQLERERDERLAYQRNAESNKYPRDVVDRAMRIIEYRNRALRENRPHVEETSQ